MCAEEYGPCQTEAADQDVEGANHEGHAADAFSQGDRFQSPAKGVLDGGHLLLKLLDVKFLNHVHAEQALPVCLAQADDGDEEGNAYYGANQEQSNY